MDRVSAEIGGECPGEIYSNCLQELEKAHAAERQRERRMGAAKLVLVAITLVCALYLLRHLALIELVLAPAAAFVVLAVWQEKMIRSLRLRARSIEFYQRGQARLEDRWAGTGEAGERFLDPAHPYARDLDLFGPASIFELLCTARTRAGEETLARWLLAPAPVDEVRERQQAVVDLCQRVSFREKLFTLGELVRAGGHPEALAEWGEGRPFFRARATSVATTLLALAWLLSLICWGLWGWSGAAAVLTLLNLAWAHRLNSRLEEAADRIEKASEDLDVLSGVLSLLEQEKFTAPRLLALQASLRRAGIAPSAAIRKLARLTEYIKSRRSPVAKVLDVLTFWCAQLVFAAENWQREFGPQIRGWLESVGELEALAALSGYAYEHPEAVFAEFVAPQAGPLFDAEGLAHPLLPASRAVANDLKLGDGLQLMILSGPNMAGKSTFMRGIGVNAVLAQSGAPVCARRLRMSPLAVAASICVLDSLSGGISRFYAEIHRLKLVLDLTEGPLPVLFLLDELLSGTNSHDRLAGTELIVRSLVERKAVGLVSTHDLALTAIPVEMGGRALNCHFEDRLEDEQLIFDYKLKPGIVQTSNALELMRSIGLGLGGDEAGYASISTPRQKAT
jgi:hypothetical protein